MPADRTISKKNTKSFKKKLMMRFTRQNHWARTGSPSIPTASMIFTSRSAASIPKPVNHDWTYGRTGKLLRINLTEKSYDTINPSPAIYSSFIGGKGLSGWDLRPLCRKKWDSPEMPLLFFTGPLVNTMSPTPGRFCVMSLSLLTVTAEDSSAGGNFGTELKKTGWDGIIITEKSTSLYGITVINDTVIFSDASDLHWLKPFPA